ncbi:F0F1 ATP synthase subunit delta [Candidatus Methylocalor cossyra]|uniref:ATP synthase subunit delta n=1 Tax=Candidatus Methylocalor cossyra TaxID=3108543 RepID=A0ABM9NI75_9GAMM
MDELTTLARPYAVAVYKRAKETGTTAQWAEALAFLTALMDDERMVRAANSPTVNRAQFTAAFLSLCEGRLSPEAENFVRLLIQNHRLNLVKPIAELFNRYQAEDEGYVDVEVRTAFPLEGDEEPRLAAALERALGRKSRLRVSVDESLIGGVYLRAGDHVIDASVRGQIERLTKRLWN